MGQNKIYHYYVEGDDEKKMISVLKTDFQYIVPGKIEKFNAVQNEFNARKLMTLKKGTVVILIFDVDTNNSDILDKNVQFLKRQSIISDVICITQVNNLEDELRRSCKIKEIKELTGSKSNTEFKSDMIKDNNLKKKLKDKDFDFSKFWNASPNNKFKHIVNEAKKIKYKK